MAGLVAACGPPSGGGTAGARDAETADAVPLDSLRRIFELVVEENDYEAQARLYAEDAIVQPPNRPARIGRAAIREGNRRFLTATPDATIDYQPTASGRGGDYAWEAGSAFETGTDSDGVAHADSGKYLWVWRRGPDGWRIVAHSFSLDAGSAPDVE